MRKKKNISLIAAHLDHQWRPESANEVEFCHEAAKQLSIAFVTSSATELSPMVKFDGSKEELGRRLRRQFLEMVAAEAGADRIALAHHAQDQEETFFIRLIRGATLTGLTCMQPANGIYIRPLLETKKHEIVHYLDEHKIPYLIDPSNEDPGFLRNRIRMNVLPALRECDQRFDVNFARTLKKLQKADAFLEMITSRTFAEITQPENGKSHINLKRLFNLSPYLQYRLILYWLIQEGIPFRPQETFFDEILKFLKGEHGGTHQLHETWAIEKKQNLAWIKK